MTLILTELTLQWGDIQGQRKILMQYDKCQEVPGKLWPVNRTEVGQMKEECVQNRGISMVSLGEFQVVWKGEREN